MSKRTVRIIVSEPWDWTENLFGEILSERDNNKIIVKLTKKIKGKSFSSDILLLTPRYYGETFKPLHRCSSVTVNGMLINEETNEQDFIIAGSVTYD